MDALFASPFFGIALSIGAFLVGVQIQKKTGLVICNPLIIAIVLVCAVLLGIFLIEVAVTRIVSLGSIIIAALYPVGTLINLIARGANLPTIVFSTICCVIMAAMVIWLHRSNIERLKNGTEYRFGQKK